jgi:hypothetical protein
MLEAKLGLERNAFPRFLWFVVEQSLTVFPLNRLQA